ncbi:MAG: DUF370 domain-containing protein [Evtepia sp.]
MYLHIGGSVMIRTRDLIGIFDMDNSSTSFLTRDFLRRAEENKRIVNISDDLPKSFVLCENKVYLSQLSSATLLKRIESSSLL